MCLHTMSCNAVKQDLDLATSDSIRKNHVSVSSIEKR